MQTSRFQTCFYIFSRLFNSKLCFSQINVFKVGAHKKKHEKWGECYSNEIIRQQLRQITIYINYDTQTQYMGNECIFDFDFKLLSLQRTTQPWTNLDVYFYILSIYTHWIAHLIEFSQSNRLNNEMHFTVDVAEHKKEKWLKNLETSIGIPFWQMQ